MNDIEVLTQFQEDLKSGLSIDEACSKYGVTLDFAFSNMGKATSEYKPRPRQHSYDKDSKMHYISKRCGGYFLRKRVDGHQKTFGTYSTLEDAIKMREYCKKHGWVQSKIDEYCKILNITRRDFHSNKNYQS